MRTDPTRTVGNNGMSLRHGGQQYDSLDLELILLGALIARPDWGERIKSNWFIHERVMRAMMDVQVDKHQEQKTGGLEQLLSGCGCDMEGVKDCKGAMKAIVERVKLCSADYRIRAAAMEHLRGEGSNEQRREFLKTVEAIVDDVGKNGNGGK